MPMGVYPESGSSTWTAESSGQGYMAGAQVASTAITLWGQIADAEIQRDMQNNLNRFNNKLRGIVQGVKMYAADRNRNDANDTRVNSNIQIELDRMRAEASATVQTAFTGASSSAKRAAMYDISRNAVVAKFSQANQFEHTLKQIQLSEYTDNMQALGTRQAPLPGLSIGAPIANALGGLVDKSMKSGAWDKGSKLRTGFADLFSTSTAKLPEGE